MQFYKTDVYFWETTSYYLVHCNIKHQNLSSVLWCCWFGGRKAYNNWVVGCWWLSVCSKVQTCTWPSWCLCHSLSLASEKSRLVLYFRYRLTWAILEKGPETCACVASYKTESILKLTVYKCNTIRQLQHLEQGDHSSGKTGNVRELSSCDKNVWELTKSGKLIWSVRENVIREFVLHFMSAVSTLLQDLYCLFKAFCCLLNCCKHFFVKYALTSVVWWQKWHQNTWSLALARGGRGKWGHLPPTVSRLSPEIIANLPRNASARRVGRGALN